MCLVERHCLCRLLLIRSIQEDDSGETKELKIHTILSLVDQYIEDGAMQRPLLSVEVKVIKKNSRLNDCEIMRARGLVG